MLKKSLSVLEYVIFISMLVISSLIGIYFRFSGGKQQTIDEVLYGNRQVSFVPVAFSLMASAISSVGMMGFAAEIYLFGLQISALSLSYILILPVVIFVYQPVFFKLKVRSVYQYLGIRFGNATKTVASVTFLVQTILFQAVVLYAPSLALSTVTGLAEWTCILLVGSVCTFYCYLGGMKAVLWTDLFQSILMYASEVAIIVTGILKHRNFWNISSSTGRSNIANFNPDPTLRYSFWSTVIGGFFNFLAFYTASQLLIQRMITVRTLKESRRAVIFGILLTVLQTIAMSLCGILIYVEFVDCDPLTTKIIKSADQILPYYMLNVMGAIPGMSGICLAGLFSASISTMSSGINSQAAVTFEDFIMPLISKPMSESKAVFITRCLILLYGIICILLNFFVERLGGILQAASMVLSVLGGPLLGLFTLGMLFKNSNQKGALSGFFISVAANLWLAFGAIYSGFRTKPLPLSTENCDNFTITEKLNFTSAENVMVIYRISYLWYAMTGCLIMVFFGLVISMLTGGADSIQDESLFSPLLRFVYKSRNPSLYCKDSKSKEMVPLEQPTEGDLF